MNFCEYCCQGCGERQFCDEVCYQEYKDEVNRHEGSIDCTEEQPVGQFNYNSEPIDFDVEGGL